MPTPNTPATRVRRTVDELVVAEMFLLQATIESATILGEGFSELGRHLSRQEEADVAQQESISDVVQRIAGNALEPYTSRFKYLRDMIHQDAA